MLTCCLALEHAIWHSLLHLNLTSSDFSCKSAANIILLASFYLSTKGHHCHGDGRGLRRCMNNDVHDYLLLVLAHLQGTQ